MGVFRTIQFCQNAHLCLVQQAISILTIPVWQSTTMCSWASPVVYCCRLMASTSSRRWQTQSSRMLQSHVNNCPMAPFAQFYSSPHVGPCYSRVLDSSSTTETASPAQTGLKCEFYNKKTQSHPYPLSRFMPLWPPTRSLAHLMSHVNGARWLVDTLKLHQYS